MRKLILLFGIVLSFTSFINAQNLKEIWTANQLMDVDHLANLIRAEKTKNMEILSVGPDAVIRGSVDIGPTNDAKNVDQLKAYLKNVKKDKEVVIYCGCCPFDRCPNIRPAFKTLVDLGYKKAKLLNIPQNIKTNWIDKDYPTND